jgi:membrane protein DedA with SNARE-associated domain
MTYAHLIHEYGYAALVAGTFLEGDAVLLLGAAAAHLGLLALPGVMAAGLLGTLLSDQAWFLAGRRGGMPVLARVSGRMGGRLARARGRVAGLFARLERHPDLLILSYRGLYGLRIATLVVLGMSRIPAVRFTVLNAVSGVLWAVVLGAAGYLAGGAAVHLGPAAPALLGGAIVLAAALGALGRFRRSAP